jgi:hypothetical protein
MAYEGARVMLMVCARWCHAIAPTGYASGRWMQQTAVRSIWRHTRLLHVLGTATVIENDHCV